MKAPKIKMWIPIVLSVIVLNVGVEGLGSLFSRQYMEPCERGAGACMTAVECTVQRGRVLSTCSLGVCCKIEKTCNQLITKNNTFFVNPDNARPGSSCSIEIEKKRHYAGICQLRLDLQEFELAGPSFSNGMCIYDAFTVTGTDRPIPIICGINDRQHVYVDVRHSTNIHLTVNLGLNSTTRRWKIGVRQIPCNSERLAPTGCLQYFEEPTGYIKSFNYGSVYNDSSYPTNMNYHICFREPCTITLRQSGPFGVGERSDNGKTVDNINDVQKDTYCFKPENPFDTETKAYLSIDNVRFCGTKFMSLYQSINPVSSIAFVAPIRERGRDNFGNAPFQGFNFRYHQSCSGRGK